MKYYFTESTVDNPLAFFEFIYTARGLRTLEKEFLHTFIVDPEVESDPIYKMEDVYDLHVYYDEETGDEYQDKYTFLDHLRKKMNSEKNTSLNLFQRRIDSCNSPEEEKYVYTKFDKILDTRIDFMKKHKVAFASKHHKFLENFKNSLVRVYKFRTGKKPVTVEESFADQLSNIIYKLVSEINLTTPDKANELTDIFLSEDYTKRKSTIKICCENRQFRYVLDQLKERLGIRFKIKDIASSGIFLKPGGTEFKADDLSAAKYSKSASGDRAMPPKNKELIDKIFSTEYESL